MGEEKEKMKTIEYLKERLDSALKGVAVLEKAIREEERRTIQKFDVRVVVETKAFEELDWQGTILTHRELTLEQRDVLIQNLRWLRNVR